MPWQAYYAINWHFKTLKTLIFSLILHRMSWYFLRKKVWPKCIIRPEEHNNFGACIRVKLVRNLLTGSCLIHSEVVWTSFCGRHCYTVVCHVDEGNYTKTLFTCFLLQIHFALKLKKGWKIVSTRRIDQLVPETVQKFFSGSWSKNKKGFLVYRRIHWYNCSKDKKM